MVQIIIFKIIIQLFLLFDDFSTEEFLVFWGSRFKAPVPKQLPTSVLR